MSDADQELNFTFRVGTSLLTEFALSHSPAEVLRELVQNEYDAGGTELTIEFGDFALHVSGNGRVVDRAGWRRLAVMLGTGLVAGDGAVVAAKVNGIGSKNFGMRSLFLFGDRIDIASGGKRTILDRTLGSLDTLLPDQDSANVPGIRINVPYRQTVDGRLFPFDEDRELEALRTIAAELAPTLVKLSQPGKGKSLRTVIVRSSRLDHELRWRQTVRRVQGTTSALRRSIRVDGLTSLLPEAPNQIAEIEYQVLVLPPKTLPKRNLPSYFRAAGGRIRLGVAFRLRRDRLDLESGGTLYYPLQASGARSGFPFSVSAPFEMNEDRSNIVDPQNSPWNVWLLEEAAKFAVGILPKRLQQKHGADAFAAFDSRMSDSIPTSGLRHEIDRLLGSEQCWPTRAKRHGSHILATASDLIVPDNQALSAFAGAMIDAEITMDEILASRDDVRSLATRIGAKRFTLGSLVRMRCAGQDSTGLITRLDPGSEAIRYFTTFPDVWTDIEMQRSFAATLDACAADLKDTHRTDVRRSPTTLTAAGTLDALEALWIVDEILAAVVPKESALHPELSGYRVLRSMCRQFNASRWAIEVADKANAGTATTRELEALARYIRVQPDLSKKAWAALRRAPVLSDRQGVPTPPASMVSRHTKGVDLLAPAVHLPRSTDEANPALKPLKFRTDLHGDDLLALADLVEQGEVPPVAMRIALERLPQLLSRHVLRQLKNVRFLETSNGLLLAPVDTYIRSDRLVLLLGEGAAFAIGLTGTLLTRLGSRPEPSVDDLIAALTELRDRGREPPRPDLVIRSLVDALRRERRNVDEHKDVPILWTGDQWESPAQCLLGSDNRKSFLGAVTVLPESQRDVGIALGVPTVPTVHHWGRLLNWVDVRYGQHEVVSPRVAESLKRAYRQLDELPPNVSSRTACLLDDHGRLNPIRDASARRFLINDHPDLALAAAEAALPVAFAVALDGRATPMLEAVGIQRLSEVAIPLRAKIGRPLEQEARLRVETMLSRLRAPNFASAVAALVSALPESGQMLRSKALADRLYQIQRIVVVDEIRHNYKLAGVNISIVGDWLVREEEIIIAGAQTSSDVRRCISDAIANVAADGSFGAQLLGDPIYFLLLCRTPSDIRRELHRRKVVWEPASAMPNIEDPDELTDEDSAEILASISRSVVEDALSTRPETVRPSPGITRTASARTPRHELPELSNVVPREADGVGEPRQRADERSRGGDGTVNPTPRDPTEVEEDELLGRRGEEIVLAIERARVSNLGESPERVVWTSYADRFADHDIKSIDDDGGVLWVEVKSTTGRHGRFSWSGSEFRLAVQARNRYVLYRVYEADSTSPTWRTVRDPIGRFEHGGLRLDLERLVGDIGPLLD